MACSKGTIVGSLTKQIANEQPMDLALIAANRLVLSSSVTAKIASDFSMFASSSISTSKPSPCNTIVFSRASAANSAVARSFSITFARIRLLLLSRFLATASPTFPPPTITTLSLAWVVLPKISRVL